MPREALNNPDNLCDRCGRTNRGITSAVMITQDLIGHVCGSCKADIGSMHKGKPGYVYIIGQGEFWKCGLTSRLPKVRLKDMQTGNPHELKILKEYLVKDVLLGERLMQNKLQKYHYRAEWYRATEEEMLSLIS
jgi:hypothetical protein